MAGVAQFDIKQDEPETSSLMRQKIGSANLPLDKAYNQLNANSLQRVRESFPNLGPNDEPPFPESSFKSLISSLSKLRFKFEGVAHVNLVVKVNAAGQVQNVTPLATNDDSLMHVVTEAVGRMKFKPARCNGVPCDMDFPLEIEIRGVGERLR